MTWLIIGLVVFLGIHSLPMVAGWREAARAALGPNGYRGLFSLLALAGLAAIVYGKSVAPFEHLWAPPAFSRGLAHALMPFAFVLVVAGNTRGRIRATLRHPMLIGTTVWAAVHLLANGDLASLLLFGGFGLWALLDLVSATRRGAPTPGPGPLWHDAVAVVVGLAGYGLVMRYHAQLFGVAVS